MALPSSGASDPANQPSAADRLSLLLYSEPALVFQMMLLSEPLQHYLFIE
jgi:hypothetical protein